ncbi:diguanylate cyclase (GGDEF)-like protein [Rhizobium azibense]|uniref:diguanylate cyclase n=1 Tax=Rhizobium azibense TaxID=1136135 RepID=A0A4R3R1P0_9HYPH|nr:GGDEF domain-containing protein [Rhizobium azibense]TCU28868.1 diguanylate cyclase (GGDEF)-like protein [Rhizobium azibense]
MEENNAPKRRQLSLSAVARFLLIGVVAYTLIAAVFSFVFLKRIETQANFTRDVQIPLILTQTRNAVKIERLSSLVRSIFLAKDRRLERQIQLQIQALAQGFSFDHNGFLIERSQKVADEAKTIAKLRQQARDKESSTQPPSATSIDVPAADELDRLATQAYERAIHDLDEMAAQLSGDAAVVADNIASEIQSSAGYMQVGWLFILVVPGLFAVTTLIAAKHHLAAPIGAAIKNLECIGRNEPVLTLERLPLISELAMIDAAIVAYGQVSDDLHRTNSILQGLAEKDPLTGLANRRTFESYLAAVLTHPAISSPSVAIMMIDIDHFKSVNDTFGHLAGDRSLVAVANVLTSVPWQANHLAARYGGEEFVVVLEECSLEQAIERAEWLRRSVQELNIETGTGPLLKLTASVGVAVANSVSDQPPDIIARADRALYTAKKNGRNNVQVASLDIGISKAG